MVIELETLVASCGGGCARVEGAVQQTRDGVLAVHRDHRQVSHVHAL
jgi:hypothetical protein